MRKTVSAISVAAFVLAGVPVLGASSAQALPAGVRGCVPERWVEVDQIGAPTYAPIGPAAGKFNASSAMSTLVLSLSQTTQRSTAWSLGASAELGWGIAKVEANTSYSVTNTTATGRTVTDPVNVPGRSYGFAQPKVEYRTFHIYEMKIIPNCRKVTGTDWGYLRAITAYPFFSECVAKVACTPRP